MSLGVKVANKTAPIYLPCFFIIMRKRRTSVHSLAIELAVGSHFQDSVSPASSRGEQGVKHDLEGKKFISDTVRTMLKDVTHATNASDVNAMFEQFSTKVASFPESPLTHESKDFLCWLTEALNRCSKTVKEQHDSSPSKTQTNKP
jgi:hypothetical protein